MTETTRRRSAGARMLGSFAATTVLSGVVSLATIPVIVLLTDANAWASVALGQAVGSSAGVLALFGWGITGPAKAAMASESERPVLYWNSVAARLLLFLPILAVAVVVPWLTVPSEQAAAVVASVAMAFGGLSGGWYLVGSGRPDRLFLLDTLPRVAGTVVGLLALAAGGPLIGFSLAQLVGSVAAFLLVTHWAMSGFRPPSDRVRGVRPLLRILGRERHGVALAVEVAAFYPTVLAIVAVLAPAALPVYALIDKVLRFAVMAVQPVLQVFQATVPTKSGPELRRAILRSFAATAVVSVVCWIGFALLLPVAALILTGGGISVPALVAINLGAYLGGVLLITYLATVGLIAVGRERAIGVAPLVGLVLGLAGTALLAAAADASAISWAFVVTAVVILGVQAVVLFRALPKAGEREPAAEATVGAPPE